MATILRPKKTAASKVIVITGSNQKNKMRMSMPAPKYEKIKPRGTYSPSHAHLI